MKKFFLALFCATSICLGLTSCGGSSYNGNVQHDAEIIYEEIFEDYTSPDEIWPEYLQKYGPTKFEETMAAVEAIRKSKDN